MATSPVSADFLREIAPPATITEKRGTVANMILHKRQRLLHELRINGSIKTATLLNMGPFSLKIESGWIDYRIPPCPKEKDFAVFKKDIPVIYPLFVGAREQGHGEAPLQMWEAKAILPIQQLMEFEKAYNSDTSEDGVSYGGIVVFEGSPELIRQKGSKVRKPFYEVQGRERFLNFEERLLSELMAEEDEKLRQNCMRKLGEAQAFSDGNEDQRRNRTPDYNEWADFAMRKRWITGLPKWRTAEAPSQADMCEKCGDRYISLTGVCKCGYVRFPMVAFESGEIGFEHVRMDVLTADQWTKAKKIQAERKKARE